MIFFVACSILFSIIFCSASDQEKFWSFKKYLKSKDYTYVGNGYVIQNIRSKGGFHLIKNTKTGSPAGIYLLRVNNRNSRTRCEICSKFTIKTPEQRQWRCSGVFLLIFNIFHT